MKSIYVEQLSPGDEISELFAVRTVELKEYSGGRMIILELVDRTARIKGVLWDFSARLLDDLKPGQVYRVDGAVGTYKGENQITIHHMERCEEFELDDFVPRGDLSYDELEKRLDEAIDRVKDKDYRGLLESLFSDGDLKRSYLNGVGGKLWHHNYIGGLAEHSLGIFDLCVDYCKNYSELNEGLLLTAAIVHDIGKIRTYTIETAIDYTGEGRLLGHIVIGDEIVREAINKIGSFPENKTRELRHLILSHQGTLEQASPVVPMCAEAVALYAADMLDSKLAAFRRIRKREKRPGVEWSNYVNLLNTHIYFGTEEK